ncbi:lipid II flippase MurJ [Curtobacterium citreum]
MNPTSGDRLTLRRAASQLLVGGLVGKLSGVVRELALAAVYGTSATVAALRVAQTGTLIPLNLLTTDALTSGFLPIYGRLRARSDADAAAFFASFRLFLILLTSLVTIGLLTCSGVVIDMLAPGLSSTARAHATSFLQVMAIGAPFYMFGAVQSFRSLAHGGFKPTSLRSTFQNVGMLAGVAVAWISKDPTFLAWGFTAGCAIFCAYACFAKSARVDGHPSRIFVSPRQMWISLRPLFSALRGLLLLPVFAQTSEAIRRVVASTFGDSVVASTEFASFLTDTAVTLIAVPLGLAALATLSSQGADRDDVADRLKSLIPGLVIVGVPLASFLCFEATDIVRIVYARGAFGAGATESTALILSGLAAGVWAQLLAIVIVKAYSSTLRVREVALVSMAGFAASIAVTLVAVPMKSIFILGLGGATSGVVVLILLLPRLGLFVFLMKKLVLVAPGVLLHGLLIVALPSEGTVALCARILLGLVVWSAILLVPRSTRGYSMQLFTRNGG